MAGDKDYAQLVADLESEGFVFSRRKNSRLRVIAPDGSQTFWGTRVKDARTISNALAWADRHRVAPKEEPVSPSTPPRREVPVPTPPPARPAPPASPSRPNGGALRALGPNLPPNHPAMPEGDVFPLGDGVWLEPRRLVSPELAAAMLKYNRENRNPAARVVGGYGRNMADGAFYDKQGDPIRFANTGKLLDGQQRLQGVVASNVATYFVVITGLPESSQDTMDTGRRRTVADQLRINQFSNPLVVAAAARLLWLWDHSALISGLPAPTNPEVLTYVMEHSSGPVTLESSATAVSSAKSIVGQMSVATALHYKMALVDPQAAADFWTSLVVGANLAINSPILALRNTLTRRKAEGTVKQAEQVFLIARAWTLWRRGVPITRMQLPKNGLTMQAIPQIV